MGRSESVAELPKWALELLERSRVARLGLVDDEGGPRVLPVTYALAGDALVTAVDVHKPKRVAAERLARLRWLSARPRAALTVDHYEDDWSQLTWVQAIGSMSILEAADAPDALAALAARYSQYRERAPAGPVLALRPERVLWWRA
jgi:PPOX class probable F420-dependent enzyme